MKSSSSTLQMSRYHLQLYASYTLGFYFGWSSLHPKSFEFVLSIFQYLVHSFPLGAIMDASHPLPVVPSDALSA